MGDSDFAIVAGVSRYPYFDQERQALPGAENDALRFHRWVTSPEGGGVPENQAWLILSSKFPNDPEKPTEQQVDDAFEELHMRAQRTTYLGRRLYIFLAGHGIAQNLNESSVLTANARPKVFGHHIAGLSYAQTIRAMAYFDEVVLFADCCRTSATNTPLRKPPFDEYSTDSADDVALVYGRATSWNRPALESDESKFPQGLFTAALLEALENAWDDHGCITGDSLKTYFENLPGVSEELVRQKPKVEVSGTVVFRKGTPKQFPVRIHVPPGTTSEQIILVDGSLDRIKPELSANAPAAWDLSLKRGKYAASLGSKSVDFDVTGTSEVVHVHLD